MKQNINIEAEGLELILKNKAGDYVIIPKKYRTEVQGMIKDGCHSCIDKVVETLPVMSDYAEDGSLIPEDKKKITIEHRPYTAVQSSTYVAPKVTIPLELKEKQQFISREQPVLKADTRTEQQRKIAQEYTESVLKSAEEFKNPLSWIAGPHILRWTANPLKAVGDIVSFVAPNSALAKDLPNTYEDVLEHKKIQLSPYISDKEKLKNTLNEARDLGINSLINAGTMELGFALPKSFVSPAMTNMFRGGSKANFAADLLQLSKTDLDKIADGDRNEIANLILNSSSLLSKMDNFDASTVYNNIKNWKNISKLDKIDTYKDVFNISQSINQQTQRE